MFESYKSDKYKCRYRGTKTLVKSRSWAKEINACIFFFSKSQKFELFWGWGIIGACISAIRRAIDNLKPVLERKLKSSTAK